MKHWGTLNENEQPGSPRYLFLEVVDPSVIENSEVFLAIVLAAIDREVNRKIDRETNDWETMGRATTHQDHYDQAKRGLARKFRVLLNESWAGSWKDMDDELVALEITRYADTGLDLTEVLHHFLYCAVELLDVDLLVLPIDDPDTNFDKGFRVLETVRKHLISPFLVPVLTGNPNLFELALLNQFHGEAKSIPKESPHWPRLLGELDVLASQYMVKILNPANRVDLYPISDSWKGNRPFRATNIKSGDGPPIKIEELVRQFLELAFCIKLPYNEDSLLVLQPFTNPYARLLPYNNRLLIGALRAMNLFVRDGGKPFAEAVLPFLNVYAYYLRPFGIGAQDLLRLYLVEGEPELFARAIVEWEKPDLFSVLKTNDAVTGARQPNMLSLLLNMFLTQAYYRNPFRIMDFVLMSEFAETALELGPNEKAHYIQKLLPTNSRRTLELMNQYGLYLFAMARRKSKEIHEKTEFMPNSISCRERGVALETSDLAGGTWANIYACRLVRENLDDRLFINFFRYQALVGEIVGFLAEVHGGQNGDSADAADDIENILRMHSSEASLWGEKEEKLIDHYNNSLSEACARWHERNRAFTPQTYTKPLVEVISRAVQRCHQILCKKIPTDEISYLSYASMAFLHSFYVEEAHSLGETKIASVFGSDLTLGNFPLVRSWLGIDQLEKKATTITGFFASFPLFYIQFSKTKSLEIQGSLGEDTSGKAQLKNLRSGKTQYKGVPPDLGVEINPGQVDDKD